MTSYYAGYGDKHPSTIEISTKIYKDADRLIGLTRNTRHPRFLDIGAGSGVFVKAFQERGWEAFGIELSESCVRFARERRNILTISQCPIEAADFPGEFFDIINFWHVIEHVRDPWWIIRKIGDWLKPGGILILGTPNPESPDRLFDRVLNGRYGLGGDHTFGFPKRTLRRMVQAAGLKVLEHRVYGRPRASIRFNDRIHNLLYRLLPYVVAHFQALEARRPL